MILYLRTLVTPVHTLRYAVACVVHGDTLARMALKLKSAACELDRMNDRTDVGGHQRHRCRNDCSRLLSTLVSFTHQIGQFDLVLGSRIWSCRHCDRLLRHGHLRRLLLHDHRCRIGSHDGRRQHGARVVGVPRELAAEILCRSAPEQVAGVVLALVVHEHIAVVRFAAQAQTFFARPEIGTVQELAAHRLGRIRADDHVGFDVEADCKQNVEMRFVYLL